MILYVNCIQKKYYLPINSKARGKYSVKLSDHLSSTGICIYLKFSSFSNVLGKSGVTFIIYFMPFFCNVLRSDAFSALPKYKFGMIRTGNRQLYKLALELWCSQKSTTRSVDKFNLPDGGCSDDVEVIRSLWDADEAALLQSRSSSFILKTPEIRNKDDKRMEFETFSAKLASSE